MLAGDTDTTCAIVGGLVGAYVGVGNVAKEKLQKVLEMARATRGYFGQLIIATYARPK